MLFACLRKPFNDPVLRLPLLGLECQISRYDESSQASESIFYSLIEPFGSIKGLGIRVLWWFGG
jgi:hypothetical protein